MKYKLIKEYPGSPKLGTIVENHENTYPEYFDIITGDRYTKKYIESYPDNWKKLRNFPSVGTKVKLLNLIDGCKGARNEIGIVTSEQHTEGLFIEDEGFNVKINDEIWRVDGEYEILTPLFYTEDFKNGSFPEKNCSSCSVLIKNTISCEGCNINYSRWKGELKGESIYEGDKCWIVWESHTDQISIDYKKAEIKNGFVKYFSNEINAKTYYNQLKWKDKLKFKVGDKIHHYKESIVHIVKDIIYLYELYKLDHNTTLSFENSESYKWQLYKEKTPEQLANKLGFKIGDEVWAKRGQTVNINISYDGIIKEFYLSSDNKLCVNTDKHKNLILDCVTNKVAIHTPTKEDFDFITKRLYPKESWLRDWKYIEINRVDAYNNSKEDYLELSIDEYMESIGENYLFTTEDSKKIYEYMQYYILDNSNNIHLRFAYKNGAYMEPSSYFSTKEAAQKYIDSLNILKLGKLKIIIKDGYVCCERGKATTEDFIRLCNKIDSFESLYADTYTFRWNGHEVVKHKNNYISIGCIDNITFKQLEKIKEKC